MAQNVALAFGEGLQSGNGAAPPLDNAGLDRWVAFDFGNGLIDARRIERPLEIIDRAGEYGLHHVAGRRLFPEHDHRNARNARGDDIRHIGHFLPGERVVYQ